jgi:hypothetical protein
MLSVVFIWKTISIVWLYVKSPAIIGAFTLNNQQAESLFAMTAGTAVFQKQNVRESGSAGRSPYQPVNGRALLSANGVNQNAGMIRASKNSSPRPHRNRIDGPPLTSNERCSGGCANHRN